MYNTITSDGFVAAPACPESHPVRMPQVTYETVWDTTQFNDMWPAGEPNPFVWSFEGTSGGTHADYMFGWKGYSLQRAMDEPECFYDGCGSITKQDMAVANQCTIETTVDEPVEGCESKPIFSLLMLLLAELSMADGGTYSRVGQASGSLRRSLMLMSYLGKFLVEELACNEILR